MWLKQAKQLTPVEIVVDGQNVSSSLHSLSPGKAFVFGRIACPMRSAPTPFEDSDGDCFTQEYR